MGTSAVWGTKRLSWKIQHLVYVLRGLLGQRRLLARPTGPGSVLIIQLRKTLTVDLWRGVCDSVWKPPSPLAGSVNSVGHAGTGLEPETVGEGVVDKGSLGAQ